MLPQFSATNNQLTWRFCAPAIITDVLANFTNKSVRL